MWLWCIVHRWVCLQHIAITGIYTIKSVLATTWQKRPPESIRTWNFGPMQCVLHCNKPGNVDHLRINPFWTHQFPYKFASRGVFAITFLLFTTCRTTCTFLERYFDREAYSVIKIRKWNKMLTKITLEVQVWRTSFFNFDQAASFERGFCNIFKCTRVLFLLLCLPKAFRYHFDSVQACLHGRECVDFGQQANMWFYTYSSTLFPQRVKTTFSQSLRWSQFTGLTVQWNLSEATTPWCKRKPSL